MAYSSALGRPYTGDEWATVQANLRALKKAKKRAGKGKRSLWTVELDQLAKDGPHYDRDEILVGEMRRLGLADVPRPDTLSKAAERARAGVRRHRRKPVMLADPAPPPIEFERRTVDIDNLTGGAAIFAKAAARDGCDVYAGIVTEDLYPGAWLDDDRVHSLDDPVAIEGEFRIAAQVVLAVGDAGKVRASWPAGKPAEARVLIAGIPGVQRVGIVAAKKFITEGNF